MVLQSVKREWISEDLTSDRCRSVHDSIFSIFLPWLGQKEIVLCLQGRVLFSDLKRKGVHFVCAGQQAVHEVLVYNFVS